jgi:two-component system, OmpR family, response regulator
MRLLLAEDDKDLIRQLKSTLEDEGYVLDIATNGEDAHYLGETEPYDAAILDLGLPVMDGLSVLRRWRDAGIALPVMVLTARDRWNEKVQAIDSGADDYVTKPFHMEEVLSRLRALLRRAAGHASNAIIYGKLYLDIKAGRLSYNGQPVRLTALEYRLIAYLMLHKDKVISRTELTEHLYDQDFDRDSNTIEVIIGRLRKKTAPDLIKTVRGLGYSLNEG